MPRAGAAALALLSCPKPTQGGAHCDGHGQPTSGSRSAEHRHERRSVPELVILHAWLDTWVGLGLVVVGMERHGYDLSLTHDRSGWRATFLHRSHVLYPWIGQVLHWWPTPWRAVQEAAWRALDTSRSSS